MPAVSELLGEVAAAVRANADELTELDRAIGDGDHGFNLRRGFDAVAGLGPELDAMPVGKALQKAGMTHRTASPASAPSSKRAGQPLAIAIEEQRGVEPDVDPVAGAQLQGGVSQGHQGVLAHLDVHGILIAQVLDAPYRAHAAFPRPHKM